MNGRVARTPIIRLQELSLNEWRELARELARTPIIRLQELPLNEWRVG